MSNADRQAESWIEITARLEQTQSVEPTIYADGDWSIIERTTLTVTRSGSADTNPTDKAS
ncbi:hypothetical protein F4556_004777 [Kitasatospora gansuensis]|uniref:Uncharacterized protein n=2 Tax=Kitasatospora TaxID=2063 RepID=A0A7W7WIX2_9ACTN|nr:hypothetical protein [Kitasatospora gansuensis]MBB4949242.1 hypothetical protein [Kitasatospora gansuensis]